MQTLPTGVYPARVSPVLVDFGFNQESAAGTMTRIDRPGNRWEAEVEFPLLAAETARLLVHRITRGKSDGLRVAVPLMGVSQGSPGTVLIDGAASAGRSLNLKGITSGYQFKEGYWLNLVDAAGTRYLHQVAEDATVGGTGKITITVDPPLRYATADGQSVILDAPTIEGLITSVNGWTTSPAAIVEVKSCTIREAA